MRRAIVLVLLFALALPSISSAATPAPKSSHKPAAKTVGKSRHKPVPKRSVTKKRKVYVRKQIPTLPSPSPKWPPVNFNHEKGGTVYAKVPSSQELKGIASNSKSLTAALKNCESNACGAVLVAAETSCVWWEVDSVVSGPSSTDPATRTPYGSLRNLATATNAKSIKPILLISPEPLADGVSIGGIVAQCWTQPATERIPSSTYTPATSR
jgi:hypothetical protein